jgi:predicted dehydrogenase
MVKSIEGSDKLTINRLAARSPAKHQDFSAETGIKLLDSYEKVLADPEVDAVVLCTPHSQHEEQVLQAVEAGKQIFCEKPLSLTKASIERMLEATDKAGIIMGVGHERRFEPTMEKIARLVANGDIGSTQMHVEANFSHSIFTTVQADEWRGSNEDLAPTGPTTGRLFLMNRRYANK